MIVHHDLSRRGFFLGEFAAPRVLSCDALPVGFGFAAAANPIWGECARLITNCIIYYNTRLLSDLLDYKETAGDLERAERLKQVSPVAWQHINFFGRYEFRKGSEAINLREIVRALGPLPVRLASGK